MGYERYPRNTDSQRDDDGRRNQYGYGRDFNSAGRDDAAGRGGYGQPGAGNRYGQRGDYGERDYASRDYADRDQARAGYGQRYNQSGYGERDRYGASSEYHGSYASDGRRFEDVGRYAHADDDNDGRDRGREQVRRPGGQPQGYDYEDRGFFQRAGDEVRSWFGDEDAERRRDFDQRYDERSDSGRLGQHRDSDYHGWRSSQIAALDRDYDEYRREHRAKFENEFSTWRTNRQGQRDALSKISEHMDVVGSDGEHVGTVDKVRGDRILLTRNDADAGGRHHSIPSNWVQTVDGKVTLNRTAAEAKQHWQDEERNSALFNFGDNADQQRNTASQASSRTASTAKTY